VHFENFHFFAKLFFIAYLIYMARKTRKHAMANTLKFEDVIIGIYWIIGKLVNWVIPHTFSVTLYSSRFPKRSLVCASRAGSDENRNETIGRSSHWKIRSGVFAIDTELGRFGRDFASMTISTEIKIVVIVRISPDIRGKLCPRLVLENTGLISGGMDAPNVRMKNDVGQKRCVSTTWRILKNFGRKGMCGVVKNLMIA
jgi:hypothetical protein